MAAARRYFYYLNERGQLFHVFDIKGLVDGTSMPSGPTYLRDRPFLDFFYLGLQHNSLAHLSSGGNEAEMIALDDGTALTPQKFLQHFPYLSLCGPEKNFLKVQDAPVVFTSCSFDRREVGRMTGFLMFGESLREPFEPSALTVTRDGKLFHPITALKKLCRDSTVVTPKGLVGAQVGLELGFNFVCEELDSNGHYVIEWDGKRHVIPYAEE